MTRVEYTADFEVLADARFVLLTTFRRSGVPVSTPMLHVVDSGVIYTTTGAHTGKIKRIRNNLNVTVAACDRRGRPSGPQYAGTARILTGAEHRRAVQLKERRHWISRLARVYGQRIRRQQVAALEVAACLTSDHDHDHGTGTGTG